MWDLIRRACIIGISNLASIHYEAGSESFFDGEHCEDSMTDTARLMESMQSEDVRTGI
jgi:hypothetical protein